MLPLLQSLEKVSVFVFLVSSMAAVGLNLTPHAIFQPLRNGKMVALALALNFVFAPAFAWLLTVLIPLQHEHAVGLILLSGAAGAPFLPKLTETAHGDLPLAVALMALLTIGTILFLPLALPLLIPGLQADPWSIARPLILLIVLPLLAGMLIKNRAASLAARAAPLLGKVGNLSLLVLFVLLVVLNLHAVLGVVGSGAILAAALYILGLFIAGWVLGGAGPETRGVLGLATSARNFGAALVPATSSLHDPKVTTMLIVSAIVCLVVTFLAASWVRRRTAALG
ncbi:Bile acid:sodium symporter [Chthoniobacter flavus Ellin428]|uniref:Bile acid:sodium symporter n=1 Tax=Chthoniobacter flavus Ellin428 TaxID=497964 RepID=B4CX42_9BACT|nr:bile acid:sodium symporter [Chthoniobacter flavus]EDY20840.1 Bile acid:sodium symporter [Chthoniobacter flavus Ellin428]TCO85668.1 BASS family bile acid:Na+ symporter [Chthoniobacter flavus]